MALIADGQAWPTSLALYLPTEWLADESRRTGAQIPPTLALREKWRIALTHVRAVVAAGLTVEAVVADAAYGGSAQFQAGLERLGLDDVLAVRTS